MNQLITNEKRELTQEIMAQRSTLANHVKACMEQYFADLEGHMPDDLYRMVISEVEKPLLETVMHKVRGNQTRAAAVLGITRSTLRKKLHLYGLD
jgi:Fis family transcriptional regulator